MNFVTALIACLNIGFFSALISRFTGASMTMLVFCCLMYVGGRPMETAGVMMTYLVFMKLTVYTQEHRMSYKHLRYFHGWKGLAPLAVIFLCLFVYPFLAVALFVGIFLIELLARLYDSIPADERMSAKEITPYAIVASAITVIAFTLTYFIPDEYYYLIGGAVILLLCLFFWWIGNDRTRLADVWDKVILAAFVPAGLFGFDLTDWLQDMKRTGETSRLTASLPFIFIPAFFVTFVFANFAFGVFSLSGLALTLFSTISIRLFGYYHVSEKGKFNPVALGVTVLAVICLFLTAPEPTGFSDLIDAALPPAAIPLDRFFN